MIINNIKAKNFKSFTNLDLSLGKMNLLIGANASGKSNFIKLLIFLRDCTNESLEKATRIQGGFKFINNLNNKSENIFIDVIADSDLTRVESDDKKSKINNINYSLILKNKDDSSEIVEEQLKFDIISLPKNEIKENEFTFKNGSYKSESNDDFLKNFPLKGFIKENKLIINRFSDFILPPDIFDLKIFDFNLKLAKNPSPGESKNDLKEDGSNLALVVEEILSDDSERLKFLNILNDILPFINNLKAESWFQNNISITLKETYHEDYLPSWLMSDGTASILCMIVALFFDRTPLVIFEEPEKGIHPKLISKLMEFFYEASKNKQVIITTHNPELLKHCKLEDIYLVSRDNKGSSTIKNIKEYENLQIFLANDLGIEDVFVDSLLGN